MSLLLLERISLGEVGVKPGSVKMVSTANLAAITAAGYLNGAGNQNEVKLAPSDIIECLYSYNSSTDIGTYTILTVSISNGVITLTENAGQQALTSGHIFVGSSSNVATDVAMSGDATMANTGALTIANGAVNAAKLASDAVTTVKILDANVTTAKILDANVTTAKILDANVTLAKLASGITPSHIIKFAGTANNAGGSPTIVLNVPGVLVSDLPFVQLQASTNAASVEKVTPTADTITVLLSADPGAGTVISYQALRAAS